jgi:hypothetical protein
MIVYSLTYLFVGLITAIMSNICGHLPNENDDELLVAAFFVTIAWPIVFAYHVFYAVLVLFIVCFAVVCDLLVNLCSLIAKVLK